MIAERMTPELAASLLAAIAASKAALRFLEDLPMWVEVDPALAGQEAADVALRLRAALVNIGALPGN
jgi:D-alanyl-D-alanine carboxypeptidase